MPNKILLMIRRVRPWKLLIPLIYGVRKLPTRFDAYYEHENRMGKNKQKNYSGAESHIISTLTLNVPLVVWEQSAGVRRAAVPCRGFGLSMVFIWVQRDMG